jgi:hypothetical protein
VASRAEAVAITPVGRASPTVPDAPSLGSAVRAAARDVYYHSWRLLPANVVWTVAAILLAVVALVAPAGILLLPLLALPTAGIFRITTRIARGESVSFWDAVDAWRADVIPTLGLGAGLSLATVVLVANAGTGLSSGSPLGWAFATLAAWGLVAAWVFAWVTWPLLVDPARAARPAADRLRVAGLLLLAHPVRLGALGLALALFLAASAAAVVALATVSLAFAALVASRYVLPAADRLEDRLAATRRAASPSDSPASR